MCLIFIANQCHPEYPLIIAANRDEFYDRPTQPLSFWKEHPQMVAGLDEQGGGTWLGVTTSGRFAALTNYRDPQRLDPAAPSRGALVRDFLIQEIEPEAYLQQIKESSLKYNDFNLLVGQLPEIFYYSSIEKKVRLLPPGLHGLRNHFLNTPWPKVEQGKKRLEVLLNNKNSLQNESFFEIMGDQTLPSDAHLPDTGVGLEWERHLAPIFIKTPSYGTRNTSVLMMDRDHRVTFAERVFEPDQDDRLQHLTNLVELQTEEQPLGPVL